MKISKIEIENINSLKGYWCIDFTHPDYKKNHDLFVICGETGAGKTTLLDAITLALYGQTPRQESLISKNEVMTKHTAKCMARVTYECKNGQFISEFTQSRTRGKIDGNLSKPSCRIVNLKTKQEFPNLAVTTLAEKNAEIIQLKYTQFCRSILLAQGEFGNFIDSTERERADILAKLTNTEKYKLIGKTVCDRCSEINKEFGLKKIQKDNIHLLSDEQIVDYQNEKVDLQNQSVELENKIDEFSGILTWFDQLEKATQKVEEATDSRMEYLEAEKAFEKNKYILEKAENAKNCISEYTKLTEKREILKKEQRNLIELHEKLESAKSEFEKVSLSAENATQLLEKEESKSMELDKLWDEVVRIDSKIVPIKNEHKNKENEKIKAFNDLESIKQEVEILEKNINEISAEKECLTKFLNENKKDEKLELKNAELNSFKSQLQDLSSEIESADRKKGDFLRNLESENKKIEVVRTENLKIKEELEKLVSTEFLSISMLIRKQLKKDSPCPVCGSVNHPSCELENLSNSSAEENINSETKNLKIASDVASLHSKLEQTEKQVSELENSILDNKREIENCEKITEEKQEKISKILDEANKNISEWNLKIGAENFVSEIEKIITNFEKRRNEFKTAEKQLQEFERQLTDSKAKREAIDIQKLQSDYEEKLAAFNEIDCELKSAVEERKNLFGEKNVEDEKQKFRNLVEELKEQKEKSEKLKNQVGTAVESQELLIQSCEESIEKNKGDLDITEENFISALKNNGFESESEFEKCNLSQDEFETLKKSSENLKNQDAKTKENLTSAEKELKACKKLAKTDKSKAEIELYKKEASQNKTEIEQRIGSIGTILEENEKTLQESKSIFDEYNALQEKSTLWNELKTLIGKSDGSDFIVFVQAMAFQRLLAKANKYVFAISGKYNLVQVEGHVDFLVHDINYPDPKEDRSVTNMSGGEKFIISLSLALGIAELASENVSVDSLFLDEGFGTLSGNPLTEAINALKQLQNSGKMLGIITHVDAVINEFDQKIVAVKKNGGISELEGSGITRK